MNPNRKLLTRTNLALLGATVALGWSLVVPFSAPLSAGPAVGDGNGASPRGTADGAPAGVSRLPASTVAEARERARLLHDVYATTLEVMHQHYFRRDGPVLPARAMEDVFAEMDGLSGTHANWIAVNTKAMSVNHEPKTEFEKRAAAELASGKPESEFVGKGVFRRAAPIPLRSGCVGCHTEMFSSGGKTGRVAGLVVSVPIRTAAK